MAVTATEPLSRSQRLDRLPFTRAHGKLLVGSGIGWALDALDVGLISFVLAALAAEWSLRPGQLSLIAAIGFVGMAVGASLGGLLADRVGRRAVFAWTLLVYGVATGASALATGVTLLVVLRFVVGLGLGAELPVASTLVSEFSPARIRGRVVVLLESFWAIGWVGAAVLGYLVVPAGPNGWRWAFAIGVVPAAYALVVRWGLPESVRFLERNGRPAEAERAVRRFEAAAGVSPVASPDRGPTTEVVPTPATLWNRTFRRRTGALWLTWFGVNFAYYGAFIWIPTLLVSSGFGLVKSFEYTLIITMAQLPG
jgi:putative MFS transporter